MAKLTITGIIKSFTYILIGLLISSSNCQSQNGQDFGGNPGFTAFIVNSQPPQQSVLPQFQQNQRFQQPQPHNQQFQPQPQNNQQFQQQQQFRQPSQQNNQQVQQQPQNNQLQQQQPQTQQDLIADNKSMSESCLACICQASTNCKLSTPCMGGGDYCGPFLISKPYWIDSGKPTLIDDNPDRDGAFQDCATDPICAAQTVRKYMNKFQKDCAGDGKISCDDLARIHLMGPFDCANPAVTTTIFYRKFEQCWNRVLQLSEQ